MAHFKSLFPSAYLGAWDLVRDLTVTITGVETVKLKNAKGEEQTKPIIRFGDGVKPLILNKTNANIIATMFGDDTDDWIGKTITLTRATVEMAGKPVEAIRVRLTIPQPPKTTPKTRKR